MPIYPWMYDQALGGGKEIAEPIKEMVASALNPATRGAMTIKEDGSINYKSVPPKEEKESGEGISQSAYASLIGPSGGPGVQELAGLTPEQMSRVLDYATGMEQARTQRMGQILAVPGIEAEVGLAKARTALALSQAMPDAFEVFRDEGGRVFSRDVRTGQIKLVASRPELSLAEQAYLKTIPTDIFRGSYWRNPDRPDLPAVPVVGGENPPEGYTELVPTRERVVSELPKEKFAEDVQLEVSKQTDKIMADPKFPGNPGLIDYVNRYSTGTYGFIWGPEAKKIFGVDIPLTDQEKAIKVDLPHGKTMEDVRAFAKKKSMSVEKVLGQLYKDMKARKSKAGVGELTPG